MKIFFFLLHKELEESIDLRPELESVSAQEKLIMVSHGLLIKLWTLIMINLLTGNHLTERYVQLINSVLCNINHFTSGICVLPRTYYILIM